MSRPKSSGWGGGPPSRGPSDLPSGARGAGRLFLGDLAAGLPDALAAEVARWIRDDALAPGVVLVGSNLLGLWLRRRLALGGVPHVGLRFVTFVDLARALAPPDRAGLAPLPPGGRALLAGDLATDDAGYFAEVSTRPGFHRRLAEVFKDLDDGGFAESVARGELAIGGARAGSVTARKVADVLRFYSRYRERIDGRFATTSDAIRLAAEGAPRFFDVYGTRRLAVYGFYDFTEVQRRLLAALARTIEVAAFAPDPNRAGYAFAEAAASLFRNEGLDARSAAAAPKTALDALRGRLFVPVRDGGAGVVVAGATASAARLEVVSAPGEVEEAREIARSILRIAREDGVPFREMAILRRAADATDAYAPLLREALEDAGIPFSIAQGPPLAATPAGKGFHFLLGLAGSELNRADVVEFLAVAPLAAEKAAGAEATPSLWDLVTRRAGIVAGRASWSERLAQFARSGAREPEMHAAATLERIVGALFSDLASLPASGAWRAFSDAARRLLAAWIAPSADRAEIDALLVALADNDRLVPRASRDDFRAAVLEGMESRAKRIGSEAARVLVNAVTVTDILHARGVQFRVVFLPGLVERGFPAPPSQDPILLDRDREVLNKTGAGRLALRRSRPSEEELLFSLALAAAMERIVLSYPRFETGSTRERTASPFVLRAGEAQLGRRLELNTLNALPGFRHVPLSSAGAADPDDALDVQERRVAIALRAPSEGRRALAAAVAKEHAGFARALEAWEARWASGAINAHTGRLSSRAVRELDLARNATAGPLSPSVMETYATCPLRSFFQYVLHLERVAEPEEIEEIESSEGGRLLHRILEGLMQALIADGLVPLAAARRGEALARLGSIAAAEFRAVEQRGLTGSPLLWDLRKRRILSLLRTFVDREIERGADGSAMRPVRLEADFGAEGHPEMRVALANGRTIRFRGRIDRIDATPDGARFLVIDYKSRASKPAAPAKSEDALFRGGEALQLPVYFGAAPALVDLAPAAVGEACYLYLILGTGDVVPSSITTEELAARRGDFETILETIASGIESGFFPAYPNSGKNCRWCDYASVCGPAAVITRQYEGKANDERFAPFHAMKAIGVPEAAGAAGAADDDEEGER